MAQGFDAGLDLDSDPRVAEFFAVPDAAQIQARQLSVGTADLMRAIMEDALRLLGGRGSLGVYSRTAAQRVLRETVEWVCDDYDGPFSFRTICAVFGLHHEYARVCILRWALNETRDRRVQQLIWQAQGEGYGIASEPRLAG